MSRTEEKEDRKKKKEKKKREKKRKRESFFMLSFENTKIMRFKKKIQEVACQTKGSSEVAKKIYCDNFCIFEQAIQERLPCAGRCAGGAAGAAGGEA